MPKLDDGRLFAYGMMLAGVSVDYEDSGVQKYGFASCRIFLHTRNNCAECWNG